MRGCAQHEYSTEVLLLAFDIGFVSYDYVDHAEYVYAEIVSRPD